MRPPTSQALVWEVQAPPMLQKGLLQATGSTTSAAIVHTGAGSPLAVWCRVQRKEGLLQEVEASKRASLSPTN